MVRYAIALVCVSILVPATAVAQTRTGTKSPSSGAGRQSSGAKTSPGTKSPPVRPVTRTQDTPESGSQNATAPASNEATDRAKVELKNEHLLQEVPPMPPELQRELDNLLEQWSKASSRIERLQGKHVRIVYDTVFETERQGEGEFAYQKSDKGQINLIPVPVTDKLKKMREQEVAASRSEKRASQVRTKVKSGEPYELVVDRPEQWSCDGQRVFSLDLEKKEATVMQLPVDMQGRNIMDSPLPFLFGMPPETARRRFSMGFRSNKFDPNSGKAYLTVYPRLPQDANNWSRADLILDLKMLLPVAVQLIDPAGTKITVYKFTNFQVNKNEFFGIITGSNPNFTPDLKGFNVQTIGTENPVPLADGNPPAVLKPENPGMPAGGLVNVTGFVHSEAVLQLQRQGLKRDKQDKQANQILLESGPPATRKEDVYTVKSQDPPPGTPLKPGMKVRLTIWTDPASASKQ